MRRLVVFVSVIIVGMLGALVAPIGLAHAELAPGACAGVYFFGSRGSGESLNAGASKGSPRYGMGVPVGDIYDAWRMTVPTGFTVASGYNTYTAESVDVLKPSKTTLAALALGGPAGPAGALGDWWYGSGTSKGASKFVASLSDGTTQVVNKVNTLHARCPNMWFVLAGYSQGAMAVHQAELQLAGTEAGARVLGTFLVADGDRKPLTHAYHFGTSPGDASGVRAYLKETLPLTDGLPDVSDVPFSWTADICDADDVVCDFSASTLQNFGADAKIHSGYSKKNPAIAQAVAYLSGLMNRKLNFGGQGWTASRIPSLVGVWGADFSEETCADAQCSAFGIYDDGTGERTAALTGSGDGWQPHVLGSWTSGDPGVGSVFPLPCNPGGQCAIRWLTLSNAGQTNEIQVLDSSGQVVPGAVADLGAGTTRPFLWAVSCSSIGGCVAVGGGNYASSGPALYGPLALKQKGGVWSEMSVPIPDDNTLGNPELTAVSCPTATQCFAVGFYLGSGGTPKYFLLEGDNADTWTVAATLAPSTSPDVSLGNLFNLSCGAQGLCAAPFSLYDYKTGVSTPMMLTRSSNGVWSTTLMPVRAEADPRLGGSPKAVACGLTRCVAVVPQVWDPSLNNQDWLLELRNGAWSYVQPPIPGDVQLPPDWQLQDVSCAADNNCYAVGYYMARTTDGGVTSQALVVQNSTTSPSGWTATTPTLPPDAQTSGGSLQTVACDVACTALGSYMGTVGTLMVSHN